MFDRLRLSLRALISRASAEREMREEMAQHIERATERLVARGMSIDEAQRMARREFGNVAYVQEEGRRARGARWVDALAGDLRFAIRHFARTPLATGTMVLVLSLGIGVNVALFTALHSLVTRPAAGVARDDALIRLRGWRQTNPGGRRVARSFSYPEVLDYASRRDVFRGVAAWTDADLVLDLGGGRPTVPAHGIYATPNYFNVLAVHPILGTGLPESSPDGLAPDLVAVIAHALWESDYAGSPAVLGSTISVNDVRFTIIGVAPPEFVGANRIARPRRTIWLPLGTRPLTYRGSAATLSSRDSILLSAAARLQPGVSASDAAAAARISAERSVAAMTPPRRPPHAQSTEVAPLLGDNAEPERQTEDLVGTAAIGALTLLILLVTCTNVSTLLVGAALARRREIAVRFSLGASRGRIVRQLVTESMLIALVAGTLSVGLLWIIASVFGPRLPDVELQPSWQAVAFTVAFAMGTGVLFGLSPALHATRLSIADVLKDSAASLSESRSRLQRGLVVAQIALTQPLLVGLAALLVTILHGVAGRAESAASNRILSVGFNTFGATGTRAERTNDFLRLQTRLAEIPGVERVVVEASGTSIGSDYRVHPDDQTGRNDNEPFAVSETRTMPGYFDVLDIAVVRGRDFLPLGAPGDESSVIIGSDLAEKLWGPADPIGRRFILSFAGREQPGEKVVIGVVDGNHVRVGAVGVTARIFTRADPNASGIVLMGSMLIRTSAPAEPLIPLIRSVAAAELPRMPVTRTSTLAADRARQRSEMLQASSAAAGGGLLALLLSAIGLYAVVAFAVGQRIREIGIRIALGARQGQVVGMFFKTGLRLSAIGLLIGLPISYAALHLLASSLRVPLLQAPLLALGIAAVVTAVASLATWLPARRAARVDPLVALRAE